MTDLTTRIAVAIHGATPPNPDAALALHRAQAERVVAALGGEGLRARVERVRDSCLAHATGKCFSIDDEHVCVEAEQDAFFDAAGWLNGALNPRAALAAAEEPPA